MGSFYMTIVMATDIIIGIVLDIKINRRNRNNARISTLVIFYLLSRAVLFLKK